MYVTIVLVGMPLSRMLWLTFCSSGASGFNFLCSGVFLGILAQEGQCV